MAGKQELVVGFDNPLELAGRIHDLVERLAERAHAPLAGTGRARLDGRVMASLAETAAASPDYLLAGKVFELLLDNGFDDKGESVSTFLERVEAANANPHRPALPAMVMETLYWIFLDHHDLGLVTARAFARNGNYDFMRSEWAENSRVGLEDLDDKDLSECLEAVVLDAHSYFVHGYSDAVDLLPMYCKAAPRLYEDPAELWTWFALYVCDALGQYDIGHFAPLTEVVQGWPQPEEGPQREEVRYTLRNADTWKLLDVDGYELWWLESWSGEE